MTITATLKQWLIDNDHIVGHANETTFKMTVSRLLADGTLSAEKFRQLSEDQTSMSTTSPSPEKVFDRGTHIRVKDASEAYAETRYAVKHVKTGQPAFDPIYGRECMSMSEGSKARAGVLLKHLANRAGITNNPLSEHERTLLTELCERQAWCGKIGDEWYDHVSGDHRVKALIDDATSGGLELVPIEFDADLITFPLLAGELFPGVDIKPVPRGRRIEGGSIGTPTLTWGGGDNTEISLFSTASLVAPIDTTIFGVDAAIEVGRDFLSDSPAMVGETLVTLLGERLQNELDKVVANGNGTTQPQGIFTASGISTVPSDNGNPGPPTLNDYETLMFTVGKQYRNRAMNPVFISNDTTYQRRTGIKIDAATPSTDQRPVFGMTHNDYETLGWPHKIENNLANTRLAYGALRKYRMYRRLGFTVEWHQGGATLARKNLALLIVRGRFGGKVVDANAFAKITDAQS
jgi:HK97 family phage major capsid protein